MHGVDSYVKGRLRWAAMAVGLALAACGSNDPSGPVPVGTFAGRVEGSDAFIAVISDGERVAGYACDGVRVSVWFQPAAIQDGSSNTFQLVDRRGGTLGAVTLEGGTAAGSVRLSATGQPLGFAAVTATGDAGLWRATVGNPVQPSVEAGWILLPDGSQRGVVQSFVGKTIDLLTAPALDPRNPSVRIGPAASPAMASRLGAGFVGKSIEL
jgi:hypothetical protein